MRKIILFITTLFFSIIQICAQDKNLVSMQTNMGEIVVRLYDETPLHRDNFITLVKSGYYDGQLFHRVIKDFMIQSGDPNSIGASKGEMLGMGGPGYTIDAEIHPDLFHKKGALAAARKGDQVNPEKKSSGSQFYIVQGRTFDPQLLTSMGKNFSAQQIDAYATVGGSPHLDGSYTVFGEVIKGFDVLDRIASVPVDHYNRPLEDISLTMKIIN